MYRDKSISVVVPMYNEEKLISRVIETMPDYVDKIIIVDDVSPDGSVKAVEPYLSQNPDRIILIKHEKNQGVGGAIVTGYKKSLELNIDIAVVMAGDAQMDPADLPAILDPVVNGEADYTKGNRLFTGEAWKKIPHIRYLGNSALSFLTKIASGYWQVADSQSGYTAINQRALKSIDLDKIYKRYGMPNDILVRLNAGNNRVQDVPVQPVYNIGEKSGIRIPVVIPTISLLLLKGFIWRMKEKYIIRDFHPLVFFYFLGFFLTFASLFLGGRMFYMWWLTGEIPPINALAWFFSIAIGLQSLFFAMWFDMEASKRRY